MRPGFPLLGELPTAMKIQDNPLPSLMLRHIQLRRCPACGPSIWRVGLLLRRTPFLLQSLPSPLANDPFTGELARAVLRGVEFCEDAREVAPAHAKSHRRGQRVRWQRDPTADTHEHPYEGLRARNNVVRIMYALEFDQVDSPCRLDVSAGRHPS